MMSKKEEKKKAKMQAFLEKIGAVAPSEGDEDENDSNSNGNSKDLKSDGADKATGKDAGTKADSAKSDQQSSSADSSSDAKSDLRNREEADKIAESIMRDSLRRTAQTVTELENGNNIISGTDGNQPASTKDGNADNSSANTADGTRVADGTNAADSVSTTDGSANGPDPGEIISDFPYQGKGAKETEFIRAEHDSKEDERGEKMRTMNFYETIGNTIFDYDRGFEMATVLRDWVKSVVQEDKDLAKQIVTENLGEILKANPGLIPAAKATIRNLAENNILYRVTFVSKLDGKEYEDRAEAEASIEQYRAIGATFKSSFTKAYRKIKPDGTSGSRVAYETVENYVKNFDGDKAALRRRLYMEPEQSAKPKDSKPSKPNKGKKDHPVSSDASNTGSNASDSSDNG